MLEVNNVYCGYNGIDIVKDVSFTVKEGQSICIVGPNGCGKSTLLKSINNLLDYKGSIKINDKEVKKYSRKELAKNIALMSQVSNIFFPYTVYDAVALGRYSHLNGVFSTISGKDENIILDAIQNVGLINVKDKLITELSGGQLQRVYLARAFVQDPHILLLDEPTNHLDLKCQVEILDYINKWKKDKNRIVVAVLHDLNLVQMYGEEVVIMDAGKVVAEGEPNKLFKDEILKEVYGLDVREFMISALSNWK